MRLSTTKLGFQGMPRYLRIGWFLLILGVPVVFVALWWRCGSLRTMWASLIGRPIDVAASADVRFVSDTIGILPIAVTNSSTGPVTLVGLQTDCSCRSAVDLPVTLAAGTTETIPLKAAVENRVGGRFRRIRGIFYVTESGGSIQAVPFTLTWDVPNDQLAQ